MKGTFFQKPVEFGLRVEGESWNQGDAVSGVLTVKNHGTAPLDHSLIHVHLAHGKLKDVRQKDPEAFEVLQSAPLEKGQVDSQKEATFPWSFPIDRNAPVTDNTSSLFLLYGAGDVTIGLGQLQLVVLPLPVIEEFLKRFEIGFRFVRKSIKAGKTGVEIKLDPPDGKAFASIEGLVLTFRIEGETLEVKYLFNLKTVEATAASVEMKKQKKEYKQTLGPDEYRTASGRWNHDSMEAAIREVLEPLQSKVVFG